MKKRNSQLGAALVEYSLILSVLALASLPMLPGVSHAVRRTFCNFIGKGMDSNQYATYVIDPITRKGRCVIDPWSFNPNNQYF